MKPRAQKIMGRIIGTVRSGTWRRATALPALMLATLVCAFADGTLAQSAGPASVPRAAVPAARLANNLAVITIHTGSEPMDDVTAASVRRRLNDAVEGGADGIVLDIDTPGGELPAILAICSELRHCPRHTIAWINPTAYSGGAIIALACNEIVVAPRGMMGDAAPIAVSNGVLQLLPPTERAKLLSPLLTELVDDARYNNRDERLVCGFATLGVELWMVQDNRSGKRWFLSRSEYRELFHRAPHAGDPIVPSLGDPQRGELHGSYADELKESLETLDKASDRAFKGGIKGLPTSLINQLNNPVSGLQERSHRPDFSQENAADYTDLGQATDGKTLITLPEEQLKQFQLAAATIADDQELMAFTGAQRLRRLDQTWLETAVGTVTIGPMSRYIKAGLIIIFLVTMFLEMTIPGATIPGMIALVALAGLFIPPMLIGMANWWALAAILGGVALLLAEIFIIPGFGVAGVGGLLLLLTGLIGTFASTGELFPGTGRGGAGELAWPVSIVLLSVGVAGFLMFMVSRYTHSLPVARRLVLGGPRHADENEGMLAAMAAVPPVAGPVRVGDVGVTTTQLRPSGTAEFGDRLIDVVSELGFIDAGVRVRVTFASDFRVGVEPAPESPTSGSA